ncbi:chemotaxis protein CheD [Nitrincola iocasae]|uniref:Probable chemoreceptor glutamine deamidase CheD n=1 Tax=Nitrincola iocasae TaxID=2614693 RepID=A0A5J6LJA6_9GAMM|nr:chemotaxis protein CheD [Nitrincola iocasae]QEW08416.1 chemotaxis protein CheD [Nitrincola iocasae]
MLEPEHFIEIFLQPGDLYFGGQHTRIRTLLGSCVSLVIWHPHLRVGGMCHFMLPGRVRSPQTGLDGRYADEAMELLLLDIGKMGARPSEYQLKIFGGGNMFPGIMRTDVSHIGFKNVQTARELIARYGFTCVSEHVEGCGHRYLIFDIWSGFVSLRHRVLKANWEPVQLNTALLTPLDYMGLEPAAELPKRDPVTLSTRRKR